MPEAIGYRVELTSDEFGAETDAFDDVYIFDTTEDSHVFLANLTPGTRYQYRLTTICGFTESSVSGIGSFETKETVYGDPGYNPKSAHDIR